MMRKIDEVTDEIVWSDLTPLGMFELGWLLAKHGYKEADVTINCNATVWIGKEQTTYQIRARKGQKTIPDPVTVLAKKDIENDTEQTESTEAS